MNSPHQKKGGFGCLGYGCLVAVIIAILGAGGLFLFVRSGMRTALDSYTTGAPVAMPTVVVDQSAIDSALQKGEDLRRLLADPRGSGEVILTQGDLNGFLASSKWNDRASATISGDTVSGQFSFQMTDLGGWERASVFIGDKLNRYVTGSAVATGSLENGQVQIELKELALNGHVFDADSAKFASKWVSGAIQSPAEDGQRPLTSRLERVWVANSEVHIRVRPE